MTDEKEKAGPTGEFPNGKLNKDDEGQIGIGITADKKKGVVVLQFGKPISWLALDAVGVAGFMKILGDKLRELQT